MHAIISAQPPTGHKLQPAADVQPHARMDIRLPQERPGTAGIIRLHTDYTQRRERKSRSISGGLATVRARGAVDICDICRGKRGTLEEADDEPAETRMWWTGRERPRRRDGRRRLLTQAILCLSELAPDVPCPCLSPPFTRLPSYITLLSLRSPPLHPQHTRHNLPDGPRPARLVALATGELVCSRPLVYVPPAIALQIHPTGLSPLVRRKRGQFCASRVIAQLLATPPDQPANHTSPPNLTPNTLDNMGMSYRRYLSGARIYGCCKCRTHLATIHSMISRVRAPLSPHLTPMAKLTGPCRSQAFNGQHGRAYLFDGVCVYLHIVPPAYAYPMFPMPFPWISPPIPPPVPAIYGYICLCAPSAAAALDCTSPSLAQCERNRG